MSSACCSCESGEVRENTEGPWYRDRQIQLALGSGLAMILGFLVHPWFYYLGIALGGATFVPGALTTFVKNRGRARLGVALLMTISAIGAILLGFPGEAATLAFLYSLVEAIEDRSLDKARDDLESIDKLLPETVETLERGRVPVRELGVGEMFHVKPGQRVPTDGVVHTGRSHMDVSAITGEPMPVMAGVGEEVIAGSIALDGSLEVEATSPGAKNTLSSIVELTTTAQDRKGAAGRLADRIAGVLVPGVLLLALATGVIGSIFGDPGLWIPRALTVLVAASPCALAICVPITILAALGRASRMGCAVRDAATVERFHGITTVAFDKTGTLTQGRPQVVHIAAAPGADSEQVLAIAAAIEHHSEHPLARAIVQAAAQQGISPATATDVRETPGEGLRGIVEGTEISVGRARAVAATVSGASVVEVRREGEPLGIIELADSLREEAPEAVRALEAQGLRTVMLSGDRQEAAEAIAHSAGIADVRGDLSPSDKHAAVDSRHWMMVGDGINDAPALAAARIGIAMGATGTDIARRSADITFVGHSLTLLPPALRHLARAHRIMIANLALALAIVVALPPLAITGVLGLAEVVTIHEAAEVLIILNGVRAGLLPRSERS
ncbi:MULTISPECIES: cation-translocating P-type ATPase [Corynebacterium]|uniref:heavy metal translocating P-type ATPase n=1 Tax=Corynebacterium TaxID=1716 RepID=UPI00124F0C6F|nr:MULTISPECIES: cation-translocating P-type ATPase [Corynebacterium]